jgi:hypothetical protein
MSSYQSYRGIPPLAGICSMEEAMKPGLSVEDCVARLKRYHYAFKRLHQILTARITSEPVYELKMAFSLHAHYCAEHTAALRKRVGEMREPPLGLDVVPNANLEIFFDEILAAPTTEALLLGVYEKALPALKAALAVHIQDTNKLADHPSVRVCRFALLEVNEAIDFGRKTIEKLVDAAALPMSNDKGANDKGMTKGQISNAVRDESFAGRSENGFGEASRRSATRPPLQAWLRLLDDCLAAAGKMSGTGEPANKKIERIHSGKAYEFDGFPRRDERFPDPYNMGVNAEVFLYDEKFPPEPKTLMMFYKRLREIDVPEMMASIIIETPGKPWGYYQDMTRQLWDEARHAMMGEVGFANLGVDWRKVMVNFTWSMALNTQLKPIERHAVLYFIEQGLMPKTGKRFEWEVGQASKNPLSALFQDYDWADEVLHARIGRDWYLKEFDDPKQAVQYGDECWSKVLMGWESWREKGLTQHRNWWPEVYAEACERWGTKPDPEVLNYATSYQTVRADLKNLSASA